MSRYLYNGIEAPELPKSTLLYAHIEKGLFGAMEPTLHFTAEKIRVDDTKTHGRVKAGTQNEYYKIVDGKWEYSGSANYEETDGADGDTSIAKPKWANHDVFQLNGTLYLAASDPIPVGSAPEVEPKAFMAGRRMGQIVRAMRMNSPGITPPEEEKIPIAYSYNGVILPNIDTVWTDKTKYLYAYLSRARLQNGDEVRDGYYLTLSNTRAYVSTTLIVGMWMVPTGSVVQQYFMDVNGSTYTLEMTSEHTEVFTEIALPAHITDEVQEYNCLWASVDICGENDSTIYLAASEPVPVYK